MSEEILDLDPEVFRKAVTFLWDGIGGLTSYHKSVGEKYSCNAITESATALGVSPEKYIRFFYEKLAPPLSVIERPWWYASDFEFSAEKLQKHRRSKLLEAAELCEKLKRSR